ncbi:MAG TPA: peptide chain release factor 2 [Persephonella sp.]|uniref:Peptide chain release factor 2 n=1 Tax=Persephonella marina (strain DSM 14350 / EX-H1) TaxID=123214 RepID=C0QST5_PERMH|nr:MULTISPECIES: peptide chain release factor 2 [Persephonella]ACO04604.1 peptide chain release factor 2 [Persephonella marina EX-H1]HCB70630.1 peptide chain release factor 2 [Persephonella sp.]
MIMEFKEKLEQLENKFNNIKEILDPESLRGELFKLDQEMGRPDFWNDTKKAQEISSKRNAIANKIQEIESVEKKINDIKEFIELLELEYDKETEDEIKREIEALDKEITKLETASLLSEEYDMKNAIVTLQAGSGGVEACDWTEMLLRMYLRWAEKNGFDVEMVDYQPDDVAGIKSATFIVKGPYAYGYLKGEQGVHRLVRISPFDANKRRHTSFSAVSVIPEIGDEVKVEIKEEDLRIDTFRASGAGGQHVNTTDSAVRIVHIPTGITVSCQSERSQIQNRAKALQMLKAKLYQYELEKQKEKQKELEGEKKDISWGSQIRSYVFQPYQMVKDLRTGYETGNIQAVMDGDIDPFIESYLKWRAAEKQQN